MNLNNLTGIEKKSIEQFSAKVHAKLGNVLISMTLFGSRARGEGSEDSDLDVLVLVSKTDAKIKHSVWDTANDIFLENWIVISPLVMTDAHFHSLINHERLIAMDIKRDGIEI